ncbi:ribonuclease III [Rhabdochlamydiaceae symbiont of Dictyostelium giganteum]|uniref:ribonuclease III n=1 Tax=Rhabdochlamydiaceae symbiont of Dictyostelium giganteum TaxID=3342349 RepID=UPI00384DA24B
MKDLMAHISTIEEQIGYVFQDKKLLEKAFIHRSYFNEHREKVSEHNERLEFLGDSVLGLIISGYLYQYLPEQAEGELSRLRAHLVEASCCVKFLHKLGVASFIQLGKGERMNEGRGRETILADLFEALIGAIYLDGGINEARRVFLTSFEKDIQEILAHPVRNWKAELQDYSQKKYQKPPCYKVLREEGPDHSKLFVVGAYLDELEVGQGSGSSKKEAEQAAACSAFTIIPLP